MRPKKPLVHGTHHGYKVHGCHCELCLEALRQYQRAWRRSPGGARELAKRNEVRRARRALGLNEAENLRRKELKQRQKYGEAPVSPMPYYKFLAELGESF